MNVLVCGARGFVGRALCAALSRAGHTLVEGVSPRVTAVPGTSVNVDYARDVDAATWLPRLAGIDVVVNAIGVLRDTAARPIDAVHRAVPVALFDAAVQAGCRRIVQVSALGIAESDTAYAHTKRAADAHLHALVAAGRIDGAVVRPSIVFGRGGASSELFLMLAKLPWLVMPRPMMTAQVQPVAVGELAEVLARLVGEPVPVGALAEAPLSAVGPASLSLAAFVASLRAQSGRGPALVSRLPDLLTRLSARIGDLVPPSPWCTETLAMLGADNADDPAPFAAWLGREATPAERLLAR
jgi:uncharacterized protein YbjT (DUF2867 family)